MPQIIVKKIPKTDLDYVKLYAENLKINPKLFEQQKMLINSQIKSSKSFFQNLFKGKDFKTEARKYLKARGMI
ncbi:MAG: hypothetical protein AABY06_00785 [Nanoarchaeota archaeon]